MTDASEEPRLDAPSDEISEDAIVASTRGRRQGDVLALTTLPIMGASSIEQHPTPEGAVLVSQTCDIVQPTKKTVVVAPLVRLQDPDRRAAARGRRPQYVAVPHEGADAFADLGVLGTLNKAVLVGLDARPGLDAGNDQAVSVFGRAVARRFGRFAFPDEVVPWLQPLQEAAQEKQGKAGAEARASDHAIELRVEAAGGWRQAPYSLTLIVILPNDALPDYGDEEPPDTSAIDAVLHGDDGQLKLTPAEIAGWLMGEAVPRTGWADLSAAEKGALWQAMAEAWANRCKPKAKARLQPGVAEAVAGGELSFLAVTADEFTYAQYRRSESLDLEHLSPPLPE